MRSRVSPSLLASQALFDQGKWEECSRECASVFRQAPSDREIRKLYTLSLLRGREPEFAGAAPREILAFLQSVLALGYVDEEIQRLYLHHLEAHLREDLGRKERERPGELILGIGPGRCGSTSLSRALHELPDAYVTHECRPLVDWEPEPRQIAFHCARLRLLSRYFGLVGDVSHWWGNKLSEVKAGTGLPLKVIHLKRDPLACSRSFLLVKRLGKGAVNHWVVHDGSYWSSNLWDACYPGVPVSPHGNEAEREISFEQLHRREPAPVHFEALSALSSHALDSLHFQAIRRYVGAYNGLEIHSVVGEENGIEIAMERMHEPDSGDRLGRFLGRTIARVPHRNEKSIADSEGEIPF